MLSLHGTARRTPGDILAVTPLPVGGSVEWVPQSPLTRAKGDQSSQKPAPTECHVSLGFQSHSKLHPLPNSLRCGLWATVRERQAHTSFRIAWHYFLSPCISHTLTPFFIVDEQLCLHPPKLQKDLCMQSCYREANDYGIVYLYYYGTIEVTLVFECVSVTHDIFSDVFWPLLLSIFSRL